MSVLICSLNGARGRSIKIYDRKCEITTEVTIGSILSNNATDGTKTIFYVDCQGLQFKKSGLTLGYLQFETASSTQNNTASDFFNENTFTYEDGKNGISDDLMEDLYIFLSDIIESYKYNDEELYYRDLPYNIARLYGKKRLVSDKELYEQKHQQEAIENEKKRQLTIEEERHRKDILEKIESADNEDGIDIFFSEAIKLDSYTKIKDLWVSLGLNNIETYAPIDKSINNNAYVEKMYGSDAKEIVSTILKWKSGNI